MVSLSTSDLATILDHLPFGIVVSKGENIIYYNREAILIHGYSYEDIKGKTLLDFVHPDNKDVFIERLSKRMKGEPLRADVIYRTVHKNGTVILLKANTKQIIINGESAVLSIISNISSAAFLYQPADIISSLIDSLAFHNSIGIWIDDLSGNTVYVNQYLCDILDYPPNEMINREVVNFLSKESRQVYDEISQKRNSGYFQTSKYELTLVNRAGKPLYFRVVGSVLFDLSGNPIGTVGMFFDISELKKSDSIFRLLNKCLNSKTSLDSLEFAKKVLNNLCNIFGAKHGIIILYNNVLAIEGNIPSQIFSPDFIEDVIKNNEEKKICEMFKNTFNISCKSCSCNFISLFNGVAGMMILISEIPKLFSESDIQLISFFTSQLSLLYENRLRSLQSEKERTFASKLLDILSHDFVNANTSVFGYLELLEESLNQHSMDKSKLYLKRSMELLERSERIIESIQMMTKVRTFNRPKEKINLVEVLKKAIHNEGILAHPRILKSEIYCDQDLFVMAGELIQSAFERVIKSILYFNSDEKVKLTIKCKKIKKEMKSFVAIYLTHTGEGIPHELVPTMLSEFKRGDSRLKNEIGLALYLTRIIVHAYDGDFFIKENVGNNERGTEYVFHLVT